MAKFRNVFCDFWIDSRIVEEFTPEDKLFYLYLLTNPRTTQIGIYEITKKTMAFELGFSPESANAVLDRFIKHHNLVIYNQETRELCIKNWGRFNLNNSSKPVLDCIKKELKEVKDKRLIFLVAQHIQSEIVKNIFLDFALEKEELSTGFTGRDTVRGTDGGTDRRQEEEEEEEEEKEKIYSAKPKKKPSFILSDETIKTLINAYNSVEGIVKLSKLTDKRKKHLTAIVKEYGVENVLKVIKIIDNTSFFKGDNNRNWKVDFDFFVNPSKFLKILEGGYSNQSNTNNVIPLQSKENKMSEEERAFYKKILEQNRGDNHETL